MYSATPKARGTLLRKKVPTRRFSLQLEKTAKLRDGINRNFLIRTGKIFYHQNKKKIPSV